MPSNVNKLLTILKMRVEVPHWVLVLAVLVSIALWYLTFVVWYPKVMHWYIHKRKLSYGKQIMWRRPGDNVLMVGYLCPICNRVYNTQPSASSLKRMQRGEKYY